MTLDLEELTAGWECPPGELRARTVVGRDGAELIQLRIDLGVMQMAPSDRPDGERYHGLRSTRDFILHELRVSDTPVAPEHWQELERELVQTNYRRMALATLADDALRANAEADAVRFLRHALADIDTCLADLKLLAAHGGKRDASPPLDSALVFDRARLGSQLRIVEGRFEEAIEEAEAGARALEELICEPGYDEEGQPEEPSVSYLRRLGVQLRREYGVSQTLSESLEEAVKNEDFEAAAELRDELARRRRGTPDA